MLNMLSLLEGKYSMVCTQKYFVSKKVGKAIAKYNMIQDGDRIMVAVSGGKDSCALLNLLKYRQSFVPIEFSIMAVYVDIGIPEFPILDLVKYFEQEQIPYCVEKVEVLQDRNWEELDCFTCSRLRKKAIFEAADRLGFQKIATGHHMGDMAETILMNLCFNGEIGSLCPKQEFFDGRFVIIRPLAFLNSREIEKFVKLEHIFYIPEHKCPRSEDTTRVKIRRLLQDIERVNPSVPKNILRALTNIKMDYLP